MSNIARAEGGSGDRRRQQSQIKNQKSKIVPWLAVGCLVFCGLPNSSTGQPVTWLIESPTNNTVFATDLPVALQLGPGDSLGELTRVDYYQQPLCGIVRCPIFLLGSATNPPFDLTLTGLAPAYYHLFAVATDSTGATNRTPMIRLIVADPVRLSPPTIQADGSVTFSVSFAYPITSLNAMVSTNLIDWVLLPPGTPLASHAPTFTDADAPSFPQRFYRVQPVFHEPLPP